MAPFKFTTVLFLGSLMMAHACGQTPSRSSTTATDFFVSSTPGDSLMKTMLQIPLSAKADFMKWELQLENRKAGSGKFQASILYGPDKPGSNDFMDGGTRLLLSGTYSTQYGTASNGKAKVYRLQATQLSAPLLLIVMDDNILHFLRPDKHFIVGNGGFSYALNRVQ